MKEQVLLITDGSTASHRATDLAVGLAFLWEAPLRAVFILDESWGGILGDEWMSSSATRTEFYEWLEDGLVRQAEEVLQDTARRAADTGVRTVNTAIMVGATESIIADIAASQPTLLLVVPHPDATGPRAEAGLKFSLHVLSKKIKCPLLVGPRD